MNAIDPTATMSPHARIYTTRLVIGAHCRIDDGAILTGDITLGDYVHIGAYCVLTGKESITIGDYTGISQFTAILTASDDFSGRSMVGPTVPNEYKPHIKKGAVAIGSNIVIGTHCTIMPGLILYDGCSIGAHSFVNNNCDSNSMYVGAPAKFIRMRSMDSWALVDKFERQRKAAA